MGKGTLDSKRNRKIGKGGLNFFMLGSGGVLKHPKHSPGSDTDS